MIGAICKGFVERDERTKLTVRWLCLRVHPAVWKCTCGLLLKRHKEAKKRLSLMICDWICIIVGAGLPSASELSLLAALTPFQNLCSRWEKSESGAAAETLLLRSGLLTHVELQVCLWGYCLKCCCPQNSEWTRKWSGCEWIPDSWESARIRIVFRDLSCRNAAVNLLLLWATLSLLSTLKLSIRFFFLSFSSFSCFSLLISDERTETCGCLPRSLEGTFLQKLLCFWRRNKA